MTEEKRMLSALSGTTRGTGMLQPEEVAALMPLHGFGWGAKRACTEIRMLAEQGLSGISCAMRCSRC